MSTQLVLVEREGSPEAAASRQSLGRGESPPGTSQEQRTYNLLHDTLGVAVTINMMQLMHSTFEERQAFIAGDVDIIASEGDNILYPGPRKGDTARAFNALARALAVLAFQPGGVKAFGHHFKHPGEPDPPLQVQLAGPWVVGGS